MRLFMQVRNNLRLKLILRGRLLAVVKGSGGVLQGQSRHRPKKFASPAPSSRPSPTLHDLAQDAARDMVNTWTHLTRDPVSLTRWPVPHVSLFPTPNHRAAKTALA